MIYAITGLTFPISGNTYGINVHNTGITYEFTMVGCNEILQGMHTIYTHEYHSEKLPPVMYGFEDRETRGIFLELLSVNGCGPSKAAVILRHHTCEEVATIIATKDQSKLEAVPTIGPKTAKAILVHLEAKFPAYLGFNSDADIIAQAVGALVVLGYKKTDAQQMVCSINTKYLVTSEIVRAALNKARK